MLTPDMDSDMRRMIDDGEISPADLTQRVADRLETCRNEARGLLFGPLRPSDDATAAIRAVLTGQDG